MLLARCIEFDERGRPPPACRFDVELVAVVATILHAGRAARIRTTHDKIAPIRLNRLAIAVDDGQ
jgi:hypothetical protein